MQAAARHLYVLVELMMRTLYAVAAAIMACSMNVFSFSFFFFPATGWVLAGAALDPTGVRFAVPKCWCLI